MSSKKKRDPFEEFGDRVCVELDNCNIVCWKPGIEYVLDSIITGISKCAMDIYESVYNNKREDYSIFEPIELPAVVGMYVPFSGHIMSILLPAKEEGSDEMPKIKISYNKDTFSDVPSENFYDACSVGGYNFFSYIAHAASTDYKITFGHPSNVYDSANIISCRDTTYVFLRCLRDVIYEFGKIEFNFEKENIKYTITKDASDYIHVTESPIRGKVEVF